MMCNFFCSEERTRRTERHMHKQNVATPRRPSQMGPNDGFGGTQLSSRDHGTEQGTPIWNSHLAVCIFESGTLAWGGVSS